MSDKNKRVIKSRHKAIRKIKNIQAKKDTQEFPWCTCGVYYYNPFSLSQDDYLPHFIHVPTTCIKCDKVYKRFYN